MWSRIISSSLQTPKMAILPSDDYCLMTIFLPCPEVVIISNTHCRNILSYTRHMMQNFLAFRDSPILPLRRSPHSPLNGGWRRRRRRSLSPLSPISRGPTDSSMISCPNNNNNSDDDDEDGFSQDAPLTKCISHTMPASLPHLKVAFASV